MTSIHADTRPSSIQDAKDTLKTSVLQNTGLPKIEQFELVWNASYYHFNNADFMDYDPELFSEQSFSSSGNSDDQRHLALGSIALNLSAVHKQRRLVLQSSRSEGWGNDYFVNGGEDSRGELRSQNLAIIQLYIGSHYDPVYTQNILSNTRYNDKESTEISLESPESQHKQNNGQLHWKLGRFHYAIGEARREYFFSDIIDGIYLKYTMQDSVFNLGLEAMGDVLSNSLDSSDMGTYAALTSESSDAIMNFQGDTLALRYGFQIEGSLNFCRNTGDQSHALHVSDTVHSHNNRPIEALLEESGDTKDTKKRLKTNSNKYTQVANRLSLKLFYYRVDYGANTEGAADISENGRNTYNQADGDFLQITGLRLHGRLFQDRLRWDMSYAYADGIDKQLEGEHLYRDGAYFVNMSTSLIHKARPVKKQVYLHWSYGYFGSDFAGMKAEFVDFFLLRAYKSYHVAPYADFNHFRDYAKLQDASEYADRSHAKYFHKLSLSWQNGTRNSEQQVYHPQWRLSLDYIDIWETMSREHMGYEIQLNLSYRRAMLSYRLRAAIFQPSQYYSKRTAEHPFLNHGEDAFYGYHFTIEYRLDFKADQNIY